MLEFFYMENITYILYFFFFYFGAIMGSFLNVIVAELEPNVLMGKKERKTKNISSFWKRINRRSQCNTCGHNLEFLDLFPIFSYIFTLGKCRHCGQKFSPRYLFVEIFSALVFLGMFYKIFDGKFDSSFFWNFGFLTLIFSGLILIFLFDLKHKIIPDLVLIPVGILSLIYLYFFGELNLTIIWHSLLTAFPFFAFWFFSNGKAMGFADWKLVLLLSLFLRDINQLYSFGVLAFWYGAVYAIGIMIFSKKYKLKSEVPFGPFILLSFWTIYFFNFDVLNFVGKVLGSF